jgi:hypothetical protein
MQIRGRARPLLEHVQADRAARRSDPSGGQDGVDAPRADIQHHLAGLVIEAFRGAGGDPDAAATQLQLFRGAGIEQDLRAEIRALPPGHPTLREPLQYLTAPVSNAGCSGTTENRN